MLSLKAIVAYDEARAANARPATATLKVDGKAVATGRVGGAEGGGETLVLGGVDSTGPSLYTVYPHGSTDKLPFVTMGSGSLAAMSVFESGYKDGMTEEEAVALVVGAIEAGIFNDLGSGSNVDVCIIKKDDVDYRRNFVKPNERKYRRQRGYSYPKGSTAVLREERAAVDVVVADGDAMDES